MEHISDEELMHQFLRTVSEAPFDELVSRYIGKGVEYAAALLDSRTDAEDAVQETFLHVIRSRKTYNPRKPFSPWFFTILKNICFDIHASRKKEREKEKKEGTGTVPDAAVPLPSEEDILELVPEQEQRILAMRIVNGLSIDEIARFLGCSYEAAKKRCQRALSKLREKIHTNTERGTRNVE